MTHKPRDPVTPRQTERGSETSDLGNNPPSAFQGEKKRGGLDMHATPLARDSAEWTFRCAEAGHLNCNWSVTGTSRERMLPEIERHVREEHNAHVDENTRNRIMDAIHRRSAA